MFHIDKVWAHVPAYWCRVRFAWEVAHIFCPWVLADSQHFLGFLAEKPEISHFHRARPLAFNRVVHDACSGSVVHMDRGRRLWVSHFFQNETDDLGFLSVKKQRTEFRLSGRCCDKF